jgi:hypothetical protein
MFVRGTFAVLALAGALIQAAPASAGIPPGYTRVSTGNLNLPAGTQTRGVATCPAGTVPFSGSVFVFSPSLVVNVNSSFPSGTSWVADVNNGSGSAALFEVTVICGFQPTNYSVVESNDVSNPSAGHTTALAKCPKGSKPLGGGGLSSSTSSFVNMNSTFPQKGNWRVDENNASANSATLNAFAVCGKLKGYVVVDPGLDLPAPGGEQSVVSVTCPDSTLAIGGGVRTNSTSVAVNINATWIDGRNWNELINNFTGAFFTARPFAVCAGTNP